MLHLFRKNDTQEGVPAGPLAGSIVVSHILPKFLKRLRHMERPHLLDLGRLSGSNIEFFARHGCKVQVEDLLLACDTGAPRVATQDMRGPDPASLTPGASHASEISGISEIASDAPGDQDAGLNTAPPASTAAPAGPRLQAPAPGARPSRRIVVPPRRFQASAAQPRAGIPARPRVDSPASHATKNALLPTKFSFADGTFDAIVAWDIFNYYEPGSMAQVCSEARRILKPGGLLLGYFQARRPEGAEIPVRYRILDETRVGCEEQASPPLLRHVYQNRDIEKMFLGLCIVDLYFLKNSMRELLMEKKTPRPPLTKAPAQPVAPKPRFTIE